MGTVTYGQRFVHSLRGALDRPAVRRAGTLLTLAAIALLITPTFAHAAGLESVANSLVSLFTGPLLIAAATLGGVFVAFRFWTGHHDSMTTFIWWAAGCGIAFGVRTMVSLFQS